MDPAQAEFGADTSRKIVGSGCRLRTGATLIDCRGDSAAERVSVGGRGDMERSGIDMERSGIGDSGAERQRQGEIH